MDSSTNLGNKKTNVLKIQNSYIPGGGIGYMPRLISTNERPNDHKSLDTEYWEPFKKICYNFLLKFKNLRTNRMCKFEKNNIKYLKPFWRHVTPGPNKSIGHGINKLSRDSKIANFDFTLAVDQNIARFYVSMDDLVLFS